MYTWLVFIVRARILELQFWRVFGHYMYRSHPFPYSQIVFCFSVLHEASLRFFQHEPFMGCGWQPQAQPPTWNTRVSHFIWVSTLDLSSMGGPTRSYATTSIALRILWPRKPFLYNIVRIPLGSLPLNMYVQHSS